MTDVVHPPNGAEPEGAGSAEHTQETQKGARRFSRRRLLEAGAVGAATATAGGLLPGTADAATQAAPPALKFLTKWEFDS